ncbi:hypothetical protein ACQJBY_029468 [Aegilops geniculata]
MYGLKPPPTSFPSLSRCGHLFPLSLFFSRCVACPSSDAPPPPPYSCSATIPVSLLSRCPQHLPSPLTFSPSPDRAGEAAALSDLRRTIPASPSRLTSTSSNSPPTPRKASLRGLRGAVWVGSAVDEPHSHQHQTEPRA